jgi:predicted CoA-binding protein
MTNPLETFPKLRRWAVVGVSNDREKYGNKIYRDLRDAGYEVFAVNPRLETVEGDPCYPNLSALPVKPDVVDMVVPPSVAHTVVDECIALGLTRLWFQPGSENAEAIAKAEAAGMTVIANACIMIQKQDWANA